MFVFHYYLLDQIIWKSIFTLILLNKLLLFQLFIILIEIDFMVKRNRKKIHFKWNGNKNWKHNWNDNNLQQQQAKRDCERTFFSILSGIFFKFLCVYFFLLKLHMTTSQHLQFYPLNKFVWKIGINFGSRISFSVRVYQLFSL